MSEIVEEGCMPSKSHLRPVLVHRTQLGFSSPHLTRRILRHAQYQTLSMEKEASTYLQVLHPSLDLGRTLKRRAEWSERTDMLMAF